MATITSRSAARETPVLTVDRLSERQRRGADCVFCGVTLTAATAVDLGARVRPEGIGQWFPRECGSCAGEET